MKINPALNETSKSNNRYSFEYLKYFIKPNIIIKLTDKNNNETLITVNQDEKITFTNKDAQISEFKDYLEFTKNIQEEFKQDNFKIIITSAIAVENRSEELEKYYSNLNNLYINLTSLIETTEKTKQDELKIANTQLFKEQGLLKIAIKSLEENKQIKEKQTQELELLEAVSGSSSKEPKLAIKAYQEFNKKEIEELDKKIKGENGNYTSDEVMTFVQEKITREKDIKNFSTWQFDDKKRTIEKKLIQLSSREKSGSKKIEEKERSVAAAQQKIEEILKTSTKTFEKEYYKIPNVTYSPASTLTNDQFDQEFAAHRADEAARGNNVVNNENTKSDVEKELETYLLKQKLNEIKQHVSRYTDNQDPIKSSRVVITLKNDSMKR